MAEAKPFASLSSGLLARKGNAKPAMRPQGFGQGLSLEDLGWNDMGYGQPPTPPAPDHVPSSISALTPAPRSPAADEVASPPPVVEQQRAIQASFSSAPEPEAVEVEAEASPVQVRKPKAQVVKLPNARSAPGSKGKSAREVTELWEYIADRLEKNFRRTVFAAPGGPQMHSLAPRPAGGFGRRVVGQ